jgi:hypothetical protein
MAVLYCVAKVHDFAMLGCPNTPAWMLAYHGSAGAVDLLLLYCAPFFVSERLCDDIQATCIASIVANFVGFCAYMAYAPPSSYNALVEGLCYVQYLRLLYVGRHDAGHHRDSLFPGADSVRV